MSKTKNQERRDVSKPGGENDFICKTIFKSFDFIKIVT